MRYKTVGIGGYLFAIVLACAMSAFTFIHGSEQRLLGELGLCLPSPNEWQILPLASWIINLILLLVAGIMLYFFNKTYNFVSSPDMLLPSGFLVMTASIPWINAELTSSMILVVVNLICLMVLFGQYKSRNATQQIFSVATLLSIGSMVQYAFVFMIPLYTLIAVILKCFRFKEFLAMLMGLAAPYWVALGFGLIKPEQFSLPTLTNLFDGFTTGEDLLFGLLNVGLTILLSLMISLNCAVKLYAGNSRRRLYNNAINILGLGCVACICCDFSNLTAYLATVYMISAVQIANVFALWNVRKSKSIIFGVMLAYVAFYLLMEVRIRIF